MMAQIEKVTPLVIGLTGDIASGKSTVAHIMQQLGASYVDADQVARQVVEVGMPALVALKETFGSGIIKSDGSLNRKALGDIVFGHEVQLQRLNRIMHPRIRIHIVETIQLFRHQHKKKVLVLEAALLYETGLDHLVDQVWYVTAPVDIRVNRLMLRNGYTRKEATIRLESQKEDNKKELKAHRVIHNNGHEEELYQIVSDAYHTL